MLMDLWFDLQMAILKIFFPLPPFFFMGGKNKNDPCKNSQKHNVQRRNLIGEKIFSSHICSKECLLKFISSHLKYDLVGASLNVVVLYTGRSSSASQ